ncbi:hypothetical protein B0H11DRAFT_2287284 [Mycena galericulata]|nr:hypothetical protein B0H11DRAFT_2287284 [Mycena galericulata]
MEPNQNISQGAFPLKDSLVSESQAENISSVDHPSTVYKSHHHSPFARLSHEILLEVLHHTLLPAWVLTYSTPPSVAPFPQSASSADLRMKLVITQVSKTWNQLGVELLYERVAIRRIGQLKSLIWALEARDGLGTLVRSLDISCLVPRRFCELHESDIRKIFELCPRLSHFGFCPANDPRPTLHSSEIQHLLPDTSHSLTSLVFNGDVDYPSIAVPALVQVCRNLQSLSLVLPDFLGPNVTEDPILHFDNLQELHLGGVCSQSKIPSTWLMPRLHRVLLRGCGRLPVHNLLAPYGHTMTSLSLFSFTAMPQDGAWIQTSLDHCPILEHLGVDMELLWNVLSPLQHKTITSLDVFCFPDIINPIIPWRINDAFPALQTCRTLDSSMNALRDSIPFNFPSGKELERPWEAYSAHGAAEWNPESDTLETAWIVSLLSIGPDLDDDDSDDYVPPSAESDDGGSVNGSDSDSDSDGMSCITIDEIEACRESLAAEEEYDHSKIFTYP